MRQLGKLARGLEIHWIDALLALGLSVGVILGGAGRDSLAFSPASLLATLPLLVRRRWPVPTLALAIVGFTIAGQASGFASLVGGMTAAVSVGLYERRQSLAWAAVAAAALVIALEFGVGGGSSSTLPVPSVVLPFVLIGAAFLAGREIGTRQQQVNRQRERATELELERETAVKAATEAERRHIARELHDVVAHSVSVMVVQAGAARKVLTDRPAAAHESLLAVEASGHQAMDELRRLLGVLSENGSGPAPLAPQPGIQSLAGLVARLTEAGLPVELRIEGEPAPVPPGVDVAAYRIVQEALTNALKYAGGARTEVIVRYTGDTIDLQILDQGTIATPADGIGRGLIGMRERVVLFGGSIEAGRRPGGGYAVKARLPLVLPA